MDPRPDRDGASRPQDRPLPVEPDTGDRPLLPEPPKAALSTKSARTVAWVNTTYFTEGLPYMIVVKLATVFYTDIGVSLKSIGYLNFLATPWNLKFLWAPLLDLVGTKRRWLVFVQLAVGFMTLGIAAACYVTPIGGDPGSKLAAVSEVGRTLMASHLHLIGVLLVIMAVFAATNDVAIDSFYMEGIPDRATQAAYSGYRVMAYRIAVIFVNFGLVKVASVSADKATSWALAFGAAGVTMLVMAVFHAIVLPQPEVARVRPAVNEVFASFGRAFASYLKQERVAVVLLFIIFYKIGDEILFSMNTPFLMRELNVSKSQLAWLGGVVGAATTVAGALLGGFWIKKVGLRRAIWPMTILMNFNIWAYVWLAHARPQATAPHGFHMIAFVHGYENLAAALGNAVLLVYLLGTCRPEFKAAHYAIGTAIMSLPTRFIGGFGGVIVEHIGFFHFFVLSFVVTIPSMLLLKWVPIHDGEPPLQPTAGGH